jgi:hypothetical protein
MRNSLFIVTTIQAQELSLHDVKEKLGLQLNNEPQFFREWQDNLPELNDIEKQALDRVNSNFCRLS